MTGQLRLIDTPRDDPAGVGTPRDEWRHLYSLARLGDETAARLATAISAHRMVESLAAGIRAELAAAVDDARDEGAQANELADAIEISKPTLYRLLREHQAGPTTPPIREAV